MPLPSAELTSYTSPGSSTARCVNSTLVPVSLLVYQVGCDSALRLSSRTSCGVAVGLSTVSVYTPPSGLRVRLTNAIVSPNWSHDGWLESRVLGTSAVSAPLGEATAASTCWVAGVTAKLETVKAIRYSDASGSQAGSVAPAVEVVPLPSTVTRTAASLVGVVAAAAIV